MGSRRAGWIGWLIAFVANDAVAAEPRPVVAVFPIEDAAGRLDQKSLLQLTDYYSATIAASGRYTTVPRKDLEAALKEKKADSYKTCIDQACQIEIGREVAAQKVVQTQIVKLGDRCGVTSTIYDLRANASEKAAVGKGGCTENDLVATLEKVAQDLLGAGAPEPPPPPIATVPLPAPPPPVPTGPTFTLRVEAEPSDAEIMVDGRVVGKGSISADVTPGAPHRLAVRLEGYRGHEEEVTLAEDTRRRITLNMTTEARAEKSEVFGFSVAYYQSLGSSNGAGLWLQAPALRLGGITWTLAEAFLGFHRAVYVLSEQSSASGGDRDDDSGLELSDVVGALFVLSTRVGYRFQLDDSGANVIEVSLGPALQINGAVDNSYGDEFTGLSLQPAVRYLRVPDGSFGLGFGLRALIPLHHSCEFSLDTGAIDYADCARGSPVMIQAEVPFGVY